MTPLTAQLGMGGVGGFLVDYALKKIAKLIAVLLGLAFVGLQYLAYKGIIQINYEALVLYARQLVGQFEGSGLISLLLVNLPFAGSFALGFTLGLQKG